MINLLRINTKAVSLLLGDDYHLFDHINVISMTKQDALHLLNLTEGAGNEEILSRYNEMYSDYQMRLTNAPTPNLRKLYQNNLRELEEARDLLVSGAVGMQSDLPSKDPVLAANVSGYMGAQPTDKHEGTIENRKGKVTEKKQEPRKGGSPIWIVLSIILLAAAALLASLWWDEKNSAAARLIELEAVNEELSKYANISNGKIRVENAGSRSISITALSVVYFDDEHRLVKFEDYVGKDIRPGGSMSFEKINGDDVVWDGSAVFYSFDVEFARQFFHLAGAWHTDSKDGVLKINLDNFVVD